MKRSIDQRHAHRASSTRRPLYFGLLLLLVAPVATRADTPYAFVLVGTEVIPPSGSLAAGQGAATLNDTADEVVIVVQHGVENSSQSTCTLNHGDVGTNGPVIFTLDFFNSNGFSGTWNPTPQEVTLLDTGQLYVQINSPAHPTGEIRGQIAVNPNPVPGDVIITEIMYNPASPDVANVEPAEWIELFNASLTDINIGGWYFEDEDVDPQGDPCVTLQSGRFPHFILRSFELVVVIPDGVPGARPTVADFRTAWGLADDIPVIQCSTNGTAGGAIVGGTLDDAPANDTFPPNDLPLAGPIYQPCAGTQGFPRLDNEILTLSDGSQVIDVVNYGDDFDFEFEPTWPENTVDGSIGLVPADYPDPNPLDFTSYTAAGNDDGLNWIAHEMGDLAGGIKQSTAVGVYGGNDIGSPGYLFGATSGNRAPVANFSQVLAEPGEIVDVIMDATDSTRPFLGLLIYFVRSLPQHGQLVDVGPGHFLTPADVAGPEGYLMETPPFNSLLYINDGTCGVDSFEFMVSDGILESNIGTIEIIVQCGGVVITEIMYNPDSSEGAPVATEWIEIFNASSNPVNLAGYYFTDNDARSGDFPEYILGSQASVVAIPTSADPVDFNTAWGGHFVQLTTNGQTGSGGIVGDSLSNSRDEVRLVKPGGTSELVTDAVFYISGFIDPAWPVVSPDGPSIYVTLPAAFEARANDEPFVWAASQAGVDGAYDSTSTGIYDGTDTGSPGIVPGITQGPCLAGGAGDGNGDGTCDLLDFAHLSMCFNGIDGPPPLNCACFDADLDGDIDLRDTATFLGTFGY